MKTQPNLKMSLAFQSALPLWPSVSELARHLMAQDWWRPGLEVVGRQYLQAATWELVLAYRGETYGLVYDGTTGECADLEPLMRT